MNSCNSYESRVFYEQAEKSTLLADLRRGKIKGRCQEVPDRQLLLSRGVSSSCTCDRRSDFGHTRHGPEGRWTSVQEIGRPTHEAGLDEVFALHS